jgi:hypothetical protein
MGMRAILFTVCDIPSHFTFFVLQSSRINRPAEASLLLKSLGEADLRPSGVSVAIRASGSPLTTFYCGSQVHVSIHHFTCCINIVISVLIYLIA